MEVGILSAVPLWARYHNGHFGGDGHSDSVIPTLWRLKEDNCIHLCCDGTDSLLSDLRLHAHSHTRFPCAEEPGCGRSAAVLPAATAF